VFQKFKKIEIWFGYTPTQITWWIRKPSFTCKVGYKGK